MAETIDAIQLEPVSASLLRSSDPVAMLDAAKRLAEVLRGEIANATIRIGDRDHVRYEGWSAAATLLGITPRIAWSRPLEDSSGWEARCEVVAGDGRIIAAGESMCSRTEHLWKHREPFAIRSMAQTRATSRALRSVLGFVMTLGGYDSTPAEEVEPGSVHAPTPGAAHVPSWAAPADVPAAAKAITEMLKTVGVPEPAKVAGAIGQHVFDRCESTFPACVLGVVDDLREVVAGARVEDS
jgi:hypothetical protein